MASTDPRPVGQMRWPCWIVQRNQVPDDDRSIFESYLGAEIVWCSVEPVGAQTFYEGIAVETGITHWIEARWLDNIDLRFAIIRASRRADGTVRVEIFRVRKVGEKQGRKRRVIIGAELERRDQ